MSHLSNIIATIVGIAIWIAIFVYNDAVWVRGVSSVAIVIILAFGARHYFAAKEQHADTTTKDPD